MTPERKKRIEYIASKRQPDVNVVLEHVRDLHNVGAVIRTCDAVGIHAVHMILDPEYRPSKKKIGKHTSAGARKWVSAHEYTDIELCIMALKREGMQILGTTLASDAKDIYDIDFTIPTTIIFGNERFGLSEKATSLIDQAIVIPQVGMVQSLNISVACAVTLYELYRQRMSAGLYNRPLTNKISKQFYNLYINSELKDGGKIDSNV